MSQKMLSNKVDQKIFANHIMLAQDDHEKARLSSAGLPKAQAWLLSALSKSLELQEIKFNLKYRLGLKVFVCNGMFPVCGSKAMLMATLQSLLGTRQVDSQTQ